MQLSIDHPSEEALAVSSAGSEYTSMLFDT